MAISSRIPARDHVATTKGNREGLLYAAIDLSVAPFYVELVNIVRVDEGDPAHIARHNVAELQEGVAVSHTEGGISA